jgi:Uma2 family endonuclease
MIPDRASFVRRGEIAAALAYPPSVATEVSQHRFDAETYGRIVASGALDDQRVELIDGRIVDMSPQTTQHAGAIARLTHLLAGGEALLRVQLPLHVAWDSVPEPDIALAGTEIDWDRHPTTASLVVEVAVSSHALDRGRKAELYAAAGVPEYWVVDVTGRSVEVHREPQPSGGYRAVTIRAGEDELAPPVAGIAPFTVERLLR